jgi:ketosteroid isomerase-like protein
VVGRRATVPSLLSGETPCGLRREHRAAGVVFIPDVPTASLWGHVARGLHLSTGDEGDSAMRIVLRKLRPMQIAGIVVLAAAAAFAVYLLVRRDTTSDEARIRKLVRQIEQAFEDEKLKECLAVAADDYTDNIGHGSKEELRQYLALLFLMAQDIDVSIEDIDVRIRGDEADVSLRVAADADGMSLTELVGHTRFVLALRKEHGRWKVFRAEGVD